MLRTIRLYGRLGARFGRVFKLDVASPAEAVRALCVQLRGFESYLQNSKGGYGVFVGKRNVGEGQLHDPVGREPIRIAPFVNGAKAKWVQVVVGAVLVVAGFLLAGTPFAALSGPLINMGLAMVVGGIVQMLTPQPKSGDPNDKEGNKASTQFSGPVNTQAQGNVVPLFYGGPLIIGSAVISAGIQASDNAYIPNNASEDEGGASAFWTRAFEIMDA